MIQKRCTVQLHLLLVALYSLLGLAHANGLEQQTAMAVDRQTRELPNVVLIVADDLGYADLGCFGATDIATPAIDRIASRGIRLTSFYSAASVCSPTRASILTGCYPQRVGCAAGVFWPDSDDGLAPDEITIAELLKPSGYATACIGKWHLGHRRPFLPTNQGFDSYFGIPYSNDMGRYDQYGHTGRKRFHRVRADGCELYENERVIEEAPDQRLLTRRYTQKAVQFIESNRARPFFLYLAHTVPHVPLFVSERFKDSSQRGSYGDVIQELDWSVGEVVAALERVGVVENTLVIFTSDNGPWIKYGKLAGATGLFRGGKGTTWEGGQRVPLVAQYPGRIQAGAVTDTVVSTNDLLPTVAALVGISMPVDRVIDGFDRSRLLLDPTFAPSTKPFFYFSRGDKGISSIEAVRHGRWKLHTRKRVGGNVNTGELYELKLYDLERDPGEQTPVLNRPKLVAQLAALIAEMENEMKTARRPRGKITATASGGE